MTLANPGGNGKHPKRRKWLPHEDNELCRQVKLLGKNWPAIAENMPHRDASGCRKRFVNYLEPCLYKGAWTEEEDAALIKAFAIHGKHWSQIAKEGILNRRSARALGWRWAKFCSRQAGAETSSHRSHPYRRPSASAAAAAAAATQKEAPSVKAEVGPDRLAQPEPRCVAAAAIVAPSPPFVPQPDSIRSSMDFAALFRQNLEISQCIPGLIPLLSQLFLPVQQTVRAPAPMVLPPPSPEPAVPAEIPPALCIWNESDDSIDYSWQDDDLLS